MLNKALINLFTNLYRDRVVTHDHYADVSTLSDAVVLQPDHIRNTARRYMNNAEQGHNLRNMGFILARDQSISISRRLIECAT